MQFPEGESSTVELKRALPQNEQIVRQQMVFSSLGVCLRIIFRRR
jgi:hypothetical protein